MSLPTRFLLAAALSLGASACGDRSTGIDLVVRGADALGADQILVEGTVNGTVVSKSTVPETPRVLGAQEDVRILVDDALAPAQPPNLIVVKVTALLNHNTLATVQGQGYLVAHGTKEIDISFGSVVLDLGGAD